MMSQPFECMACTRILDHIYCYSRGAAKVTMMFGC
jgi:hypothetical protein